MKDINKKNIYLIYLFIQSWKSIKNHVEIYYVLIYVFSFPLRAKKKSFENQVC